MRRMLVLLIAACGGSPDPDAAVRPAGPAASPIATPARAADVIVASVNGRPVWGSCVTVQARGGTSKQAALDECIAFELLAQEAEARGLVADPEVAEATKTALVDRLVETGFEQRYATPADLADVLDAHIERHKARLQRAEARASAFVRIEVPDNAPPAENWRAKELADKVAARLAGEAGLTAAHLVDAAREVVGTQKFTHEIVPPYVRDGLVESYADALFGIAEVGRIHPEAVRTKWGWDVILLNGILEPKTYTREEAAAEAFPELRRQYFAVWVNQIVKSLGVKITIDQAQVAKLDEVGQ